MKMFVAMALAAAVSVSAQAAVYHVPGDFDTLQDVTFAVQDGDTVFVHGSHTAINVQFNHAITIAGGDAEAEIYLEGVLSAGSATGPIRIEHIAFTGGGGRVVSHSYQLEMWDCSLSNSSAQIDSISDGSISLHNCVFDSNTRTPLIDAGNAAFVTIDNCVFIDNASSGLVVSINSRPVTCDNTLFLRNECTQVLSGHPISINNSHFIENGGTAFYASTANATACTVIDGGGEGAFFQTGSMLDCEISGCELGGARTSVGIVQDCTIEGNGTGAPDGGYQLWVMGQATVDGCVLRGCDPIRDGDSATFGDNIIDDSTCPACHRFDIDDNGVVSLSDLLVVLSAWGPCSGCPADFDASGGVGYTDLLAILSAWGECP